MRVEEETLETEGGGPGALHVHLKDRTVTLREPDVCGDDAPVQGDRAASVLDAGDDGIGRAMWGYSELQRVGGESGLWFPLRGREGRRASSVGPRGSPVSNCGSRTFWSEIGSRLRWLGFLSKQRLWDSVFFY